MICLDRRRDVQNKRLVSCNRVFEQFFLLLYSACRLHLWNGARISLLVLAIEPETKIIVQQLSLSESTLHINEGKLFSFSEDNAKCSIKSAEKSTVFSKKVHSERE